MIETPWREAARHCGASGAGCAGARRGIACDCSICAKKGILHVIVPRGEFELLSDEGKPALYRLGSQTAKHCFRRHCGIAPFYVPRSHPEGVSVNARCIEDVVLDALEIVPLDGRNREKNVEKIR